MSLTATLEMTPAALYDQLAEEFAAQADGIEPGQVALRYQQALTLKFAQMTPYRREMAVVFSSAMHDEQPRSLENDTMRLVFAQIVSGSTDAPTKPDDSMHLSQLLYAFYILSVIFWLYDRTEKRRATGYLIEFLYDMIRLMRPFMIMPMFTKAMQKMAVIMEMVFGVKASVSERP